MVIVLAILLLLSVVVGTKPPVEESMPAVAVAPATERLAPIPAATTEPQSACSTEMSHYRDLSVPFGTGALNARPRLCRAE